MQHEPTGHTSSSETDLVQRFRVPWWSDDLLGKWIGVSISFLSGIVSRAAAWWGGGCVESVLPKTKQRGHKVLLIFFLAQGLLLPIFQSGFLFWLPNLLITLLAFAIAQFLADRFIDAGTSLLSTGHAHVNSRVLLDITGLLSLLVGLAAIGAGAYLAVVDGGRQILTAMIVLSLGSILLPLAVFAFQPHLVGVQTSSTASAGEEAIGLLSFFVRSGLALASFWYLFGGFWAMVGILLAVWTAMAFGLQTASVVFGISQLSMLAAAVIPLVLYLLYLIQYLGIDILRAFLDIRRNVEILAEREAAPH